MMSNAQSDIRKYLPNFDVARLIGELLPFGSGAPFSTDLPCRSLASAIDYANGHVAGIAEAQTRVATRERIRDMLRSSGGSW
jgi:hypothetical protein